MTAAVVTLLSACISNDLPYPWVMPSVDSITVTAVDADGHDLLSGPVVIDSINRSVTMELTEWADIRNVTVEDIEFTEGTTCLDLSVFDSPLDLRQPVTFRLERYDRVFDWTISAVQTIDRYFTVASQIGTSQIDPENHTVTALVPTAQPLDNIVVRSMKLSGPYGTMTPDLVGRHVDFSVPVTVTVSEFGYDTEWTVSISQTDVSVDLERVDAWTNVAWLYANAEEGKANGFEYRRADAGEWIAVPADWVTHNGGSFYARLIHLDAQTDYVARAVSDGDHSVEVEFTTGKNVQLPNSDFREWHQDGKIWNPWDADDVSFWSTGNKGATTLGQSNTVPQADAASPTGFSGAVLETKFVGISILGKLAAGNLFAGDFVKVDGTNGILDFGRPFSQRPTKLRARLKYTTAPITDLGTGTPAGVEKGQNDECIVWCALGDWDQPYEIRTNPSNRKLFSSDDDGVIAYGEYSSGETIPDFIEVEITLDYKSTQRVPTYLLVTASASKYGDYFTGGRGAILYIDSYELLYDY